MNNSPINRTTQILLTSLAVYLILLILITSIYAFLSSGVVGLGGSTSVPEDSPIILSENNANHILRLWAPPSTSTVVLYDQWDIRMFGNVNDTYKVKINDAEMFNGSLTQEHLNLSFDASRLGNAHVTVMIGNRSYRWVNIAINHQEIGYNGPGGSGGSNLKFTSADISRAQLKASVGVAIATILSIPVVWHGVRLWRSKQGVRSL